MAHDIKFDQVSFTYAGSETPALRGIDLFIKTGEIVLITGPAGSGKTTLCSCINGLIPHFHEGELTGDVTVGPYNTRKVRVGGLASLVGMVFQDPETQLFSPTVEDEIAFAPENLCLPTAQIRERVDHALDLLGIAALREANPYKLSGGEKHLVALAAVLALDPPVLLLDEVMSQLDRAGKKRVAAALQRLRDMGKAVIAVEHNLEAVSFADRLLVMEKGTLLCDEPTASFLADRVFLNTRGLL